MTKTEKILCILNDLMEWLTRLSPAFVIMLVVGIVCILLSIIGGWDFSGLIHFKDGKSSLKFDTPAGGISPVFRGVLFFTGVFFLTGGVVWEIARWQSKNKSLLRKKVIVVEARGLRDIGGKSLVEAVPQQIKSHRESVFIDLRQGILDGEIFDPDSALDKVTSLPIELKRRENGLDQSDITLVYGGLSPVPFTFLTGVLIDDERSVMLFDWDRHAEVWREIDGPDDGLRFTRSAFEDVPDTTKQVVLAVSVSYRVRNQDVHAKIEGVPLIRLDLDGRSLDCHWSEEKQRSLGQQFLETVVGLGNKGVEKIHLFLAAPNSLVFRFGRLYDKRNLPSVVVYQYQRGASPPYPWGILMPVAGFTKPDVVKDKWS